MRPPAHTSAHTRSRFGGVGAAWWVTRWLLVLLLAFDQFSSPFHMHEHDGVGTAHELSASAELLHELDTQMAGEEKSLASHAVMAIKSEPLQSVQQAANDNADPQSAALWTDVSHPTLNEPASGYWRSDQSRPVVRSHRSLPPPGRAPPLQA